MDIKCFSTKMDKSEAEQIAMAKGGFFWRMVFKGMQLSEVRQHFIEFKLITFEVIHKPTIIHRLFFRQTETKRQTIRMLANGSSGSVAWVESSPEIFTLNNVDENTVQKSDKDIEYLTTQGRKVALRVVHRFRGGIPELEVISIESIFRPYWVALYGNVGAGKKVRYIPIAADGCGTHRSF